MSDIESANNEHARRVREMFGSIAARYDLLNHLLSINIDKRWRRKLAQTVYADLPLTDLGQAQILDVACGTGDLSFTLLEVGQTFPPAHGSEGQRADGNVCPAKERARVTGVDFSRPMLQIAKDKSARQGFNVSFIEADALRLPFANGSFDAVTIGFGLRNLTSVTAGFKELLRVLKPRGRVAVLEFSKPTTPILRSLFKIYFKRVLPLFGGLISGSRSAYEYLPDSVERFPDQAELAAIMASAGFVNVTFQNLTGGIAALHLGTRPE